MKNKFYFYLISCILGLTIGSQVPLYGKNTHRDGSLNQPIEIYKSSKGKFGLRRGDKNILKAQYDSIGAFSGNYALAIKNGKAGVINKDGKVIIKCNYSAIDFPVTPHIDSSINPYFIATDAKTNLKYLVCNNKVISKPYKYIVNSPSIEFFGSYDGNSWDSNISDLNSTTSFEASHDDMKIKSLANNYTLFNNRIFDPDGKMLDYPGDGYKRWILNRDVYLWKEPYVIGMKNLPEMEMLERDNSQNFSALQSKRDSIYGIYRKYHRNVNVQSSSQEELSSYLIYNDIIHKVNPFQGSDSIFIITREDNGKLGILSTQGILIPPKFDDIRVYESPNKKTRLLSFTSKYFTSILSYNDIPPLLDKGNESEFKTFLHEKTLSSSKVYFPNGKEINVSNNPDFILTDHNQIGIKGNTSYSLYDSKGQILVDGLTQIELKELSIHPKIGRIIGRQERILQTEVDSLLGLWKIDNDSLLNIIPNRFKEISAINNNEGTGVNYIVSDGDYFGMYSEDGICLLPCEYIQIKQLYRLYQDIKPILYYVQLNDKLGLVDSNGKILLPCEFSNILNDELETDTHVLPVRYPDGRSGVINYLTGNFNPSYDKFGLDGIVYKNGKMGLIDEETLKLVIPCVYEPGALGFESRDMGKDTRIALGYETATRTVVDIWTKGGKKLASKTFGLYDTYAIARFIENWVGVRLTWD